MPQKVINPKAEGASPQNPTLTPANQNPWYVLMTLYGEQDGKEIDWVLHEKNRCAWSAWAGKDLETEQRDFLSQALRT